LIGVKELNQLARRGTVSDRAQEKDYVLAWLLAALSSLGPGQLIFKGGTALRRCYFLDYRYSEDLDFSLLVAPGDLNLPEAMAKWFEWIRGASGIGCEFNEKPTQDATGFRAYIAYTGPLGASGARRTIKIDANSDEVIRTTVESRPILSHYSDLQEPTHVLAVYSLIEIWAEKARSLIQRTEPRDLYDLGELVNFDSDLPRESLLVYIDKIADKGIDRGRLQARLQEAEETFARLWESRLSDQVPSIPHFNEVWRRVRRAFREGGYFQ
jgi:predicted nucleotidyltransferase component of viral defense system